MGVHRASSPRRLERLIDELAEHGLDLRGAQPWHSLAVAEIDYALRPAVHERRIPSFGALVAPGADGSRWSSETGLGMQRRPAGDTLLGAARKYADGQSSWLIRDLGGDDEWVVFDRPAGSERDLVVIAEALQATVVQRHPAGAVRVVGDFGVLRWNGLDWSREPLVRTWLDLVDACSPLGERDVVEALLEFAVHDLGARGIGATLVYRPDRQLESSFDDRLATPPPLQILRASDLAPLRHALGQVDGASLFDESGTLRHIGVRLVPTARAEVEVEGLRGTRHTSGLRYSADDPGATVVIVSEDGPVTVMRAGKVVGASATASG